MKIKINSYTSGFRNGSKLFSICMTLGGLEPIYCDTDIRALGKTKESIATGLKAMIDELLDYAFDTKKLEIK